MKDSKIYPARKNYFQKNCNKRRRRRQRMSQKVLTQEQLMSPNITIKGILTSKNNGAKKQQKQIPSKQIKIEPSQPNTNPVTQQQTRQKLPKFLMKPHIVLVNGKPLPVRTIIFKEDALFVPPQDEKRITSGSFMKKCHTQRWTHEETRKFYKLLEIFGCDFSLIKTLFKDRTRLQIKNKFRKEERINNKWIEYALLRHNRIKPKRLNKRINKLNKILLKDAEWIENQSANKSTNSSFLNSSDDASKKLYKCKYPDKKQKIDIPLEQVKEQEAPKSNEKKSLSQNLSFRSSKKSSKKDRKNSRNSSLSSQDSVDRQIIHDIGSLFKNEIQPFYNKNKDLFQMEIESNNEQQSPIIKMEGSQQEQPLIKKEEDKEEDKI